MAEAKPVSTSIHEDGTGVEGGMPSGPPNPPGAVAGGYVSARVSIVTAPLSANSLPAIRSPVVVVIEMSARIFPIKVAPVPSRMFRLTGPNC